MSVCIALYDVVLSILLNRSNNFNVYIHLTAIKSFHPVYMCHTPEDKQKYPSTFVRKPVFTSKLAPLCGLAIKLNPHPNEQHALPYRLCFAAVP